MFEAPIPQSNDARLPDLRSEDGIFRVLESGSPQSLRDLADLYGFSDADITFYRSYVRLRAQTLEEMRPILKRRIASHPAATSEEFALGVYRERLEPQVRDAVLALFKKGYTTISSGFEWLDRQHILFAKDYLRSFVIPTATLQSLEQRGVVPVVRPNSIGFELYRTMTLQEIKEIWDILAAALPPLEHPPGPSLTKVARLFRSRTASQ
jgi:hypothetical protein